MKRSREASRVPQGGRGASRAEASVGLSDHRRAGLAVQPDPGALADVGLGLVRMRAVVLEEERLQALALPRPVWRRRPMPWSSGRRVGPAHRIGAASKPNSKGGRILDFHPTPVNISQHGKRAKHRLDSISGLAEASEGISNDDGAL